MVERKPNGEILLEKKKGLNVREKEIQKLRELKKLKELREASKRIKKRGVPTDIRNVSFKNSAQIIPSGEFRCLEVVGIVSPVIINISANIRPLLKLSLSLEQSVSIRCQPPSSNHRAAARPKRRPIRGLLY